MAGLARLAAQHGVIKEEQVESIIGLSIMQKLAVVRHGQREVTPEQAREFVVLAQGLTYMINSVGRSA